MSQTSITKYYPSKKRTDHTQTSRQEKITLVDPNCVSNAENVVKGSETLCEVTTVIKSEGSKLTKNNNHVDVRGESICYGLLLVKKSIKCSGKILDWVLLR